MHPLYEEFLKLLDKEDKENCIDFILTRLEHGEIQVVELYNTILTPALREKYFQEENREIRIWEEHMSTSIVRTIVECCYPYVIKERKNKRYFLHNIPKKFLRWGSLGVEREVVDKNMKLTEF